MNAASPRVIVFHDVILPHHGTKDICASESPHSTEFIRGTIQIRPLFIIRHLTPAIPQALTEVNHGTVAHGRVLFKIILDALQQENRKGALVKFILVKRIGRHLLGCARYV